MAASGSKNEPYNTLPDYQAFRSYADAEPGRWKNASKCFPSSCSCQDHMLAVPISCNVQALRERRSGSKRGNSSRQRLPTPHPSGRFALNTSEILCRAPEITSISAASETRCLGLTVILMYKTGCHTPLGRLLGPCLRWKQNAGSRAGLSAAWVHDPGSRTRLVLMGLSPAFTGRNAVATGISYQASLARPVQYSCADSSGGRIHPHGRAGIQKAVTQKR